MTIKKKTLFTIALALTLCLALSGCMMTNQPAEPEATLIPSPAPNATDLTQATPTTQPGATTGTENNVVQEKFDWRVKAPMVEARINMLSEIADSRVVTYGTTALVGVKFANQYKGELTQRIRDMIAGEVKSADESIQVVAVTAEANDVTTIFDLSEKLKTGVSEEELRDDIEKITRNATTLR